jgi:hypothetical protein
MVVRLRFPFFTFNSRIQVELRVREFLVILLEATELAAKDRM